jgi:hypothetical protein
MSVNEFSRQNPVQSGMTALAVAGGVGLVAITFFEGSGRLAIAAVIGLFAGLSLYHASFGFTAAWRQFALDHRGAGLRAQFLLILLTSAISFPLLENGGFFGRPLYGAVAPFGYSAALGAFIFGIGMQFGGSCASGTLFTAGGGNTRMLATLSGFIAGSVIATAHMPFWWSLPALAPYSLVESFGAVAAFAITALALGIIGYYSILRERRKYGSLEPPAPDVHVLRGPWHKSWGAVAIAIVGIATLLTLSRPWGITSAFALWGAKIARNLGWNVEQWGYWSGRSEWLDRSIFSDGTSVMNIGIMIGAYVAASLAGRFAPKFRLGPGELFLALAGGLLMGYGARLAYGCNIGAYLGGIISGSLHGWGWLVFGFLGSLVGLRARKHLDYSKY